MPGHSWNPFRHRINVKFAPDQAEKPSVSTSINAVYYPNWRVYRKQPPSSLNLDFITHIYYSFARVDHEGNVLFTDSYADTEVDLDGIKGCINDLRSIKARFPHINTILSLGGGGQGSEPFPRVAADQIVRSLFAQNARRMVDTYGLDGIDVDWEHPHDPLQGHHYVQMLAALRKALPAPRYLLTSALPAGEWALTNINLGKASEYLDLINLMAYDFSGPWSDACGHQAQLYSPQNPHNDAARISGDAAVTYLISKGVTSKKILLGIPAYGRSFLKASSVGSRYSGHGGQEGIFEYRDLPRPGSVVYYDERVTAVCCIGGDGGFVTYDDPNTVREKANYAKRRALGGLFFWTGTGDRNDSKSLVQAGFSSLHAS